MWKSSYKSWYRKCKKRYGILECGGEGDCLFFCIIEALKEFDELDNELGMDVEQLRNIVSYQITEENYPIILENYKLEQENNLIAKI